MPVLSWASILAFFYDSLLYNSRVCLPGNAMSILLEYFPTFSGKHLVMPRLARVEFSIVDFIPGSSVCGQDPGRVASFAFSLAIFLSSFLSATGVY